jgi:hypothetical protein
MLLPHQAVRTEPKDVEKEPGRLWCSVVGGS